MRGEFPETLCIEQGVVLVCFVVFSHFLMLTHYKLKLMINFDMHLCILAPG